MSGPHAALGRSMERAALMAQAPNDRPALLVFDSGDTPQGAMAAARAARRDHAAILIGPVFAGQVPGVLAIAAAGAAAGAAVPVLTFSNDAALTDHGAFVFGITARQSVTAILRYAASRGVRRIGLAAGTTGAGWDAQLAVAATALAPGLGLAIAGAASDPPDAVLVGSTADLARLAPQAKAQGVQLLGAPQSLDLAEPALRTLDGAWIAAPDPQAFASFAKAFEDRNGSAPGLIAGLAFDAVGIVRRLRRAGGVDRSGLLAPAGFAGVCGAVRLRDDGSATRALVVLGVGGGQLRRIDAA